MHGATHTQKDDVENNGGSLENVERSLCCFFAAFSCFWGLVSSQYLISTRWVSRRVLLRSLGRCCLGLVAPLVAGSAAGMLSVSLNCPLPLRRTHPPTLVWRFYSKTSSITPARQMVHVHQKPISQEKQTNCDKPHIILTRARVLTMCLSPNCLMPESQASLCGIFSLL